MVDEKVNQVDDRVNGWELPVLLFGGFRTLVDALHVQLASEGHPDARPVHGFAMQAIGIGGVTGTELGRRLGVTKQAAGKTVDRLIALGYAERADDARDARRKIVRLTPRGLDCLTRSARIFDALRASWVATLGPTRVAEIETSLRAVVPTDALRVDAPGWMGL